MSDPIKEFIEELEFKVQEARRKAEDQYLVSKTIDEIRIRLGHAYKEQQAQESEKKKGKAS